MHRFYLSPHQCSETILTLTGHEAHHAAQVLRLRVGEPALILDGAGHEFFCETRAVSKKTVQFFLKEKKFTPPLPHRITLFQAIPKGKIMESIIQKATELGVSRIVPLLTERVTTHLESAQSEIKAEKWRSTAIEAIKQCGQVWLPQIESPVSPKDFLARSEKLELSFVGSLQKEGRPAREYFQKFFAQEKRLPKSLGVWVGPEGDLTPAELSAIQVSGVWPITLGRLVLRCETAAIFCLAILNYELQCNKNGEGTL
ncbi:MAG: RsmE family RNA methyltransferase [Limisphaerales bacterium]